MIFSLNRDHTLHGVDEDGTECDFARDAFASPAQTLFDTACGKYIHAYRTLEGYVINVSYGDRCAALGLIIETTTRTLPKLPSDLITLALADLAKVEANPCYAIDMNDWHRPAGMVCAVCFAGAVMAQTLEVDPTDYAAPSYFDDHSTYSGLRALNYLRVGHVTSALQALDLTHREGLDSYVTPYALNPAQFRVDLTSLASTLASAGL